MLSIVPCTLRQAKAYVAEHHRHHRPPQGGLLAMAVLAGDRLCGVAIIGRPVARALDDGRTVEVTRLCTDGTRNACSALYARARRAALALGYTRVLTYTLEEECGASLRGAGWTAVATTRGGSWDTPSRRRFDNHPLQRKVRWETA
ncbi:XF1762 family protein [Pseudoxanthomonas sp. USHLN014]|uniref:XF1762 family protein n=1 Tax=Pseudoxanthomonas sp. USHLN014 TaxID=3081297 RepID=UPI00301CC6F7